MNLTDIKQLFADEEAVSPVIGVILMVAITVILAAVIGTFVLGLGDNVQNEAPQSNFQFSYSGNFEAGTDSGFVEITHNGGQNVDHETLSIQVGSAATVESTDLSGDWDGTISTGDSILIAENAAADNSEDVQLADNNAEPGEDVRIIWSNPSGGSSNTIGSSQIP